jgi:hypothetical protein
MALTVLGQEARDAGWGSWGTLKPVPPWEWRRVDAATRQLWFIGVCAGPRKRSRRIASMRDTPGIAVMKANDARLHKRCLAHNQLDQLARLNIARSNRAILIVMPTHKLTPEIINAAIVGFEQQKVRIDAQIADLRAMLDGGPAEPATTQEAPTRKRKISAAARRRMALGQKARWAKLKGESEPPAPATPEPSKPKRKLSKEGRAAIVAALKKRWREKKAAAAKAAPAVAKKSTVKKAVAKKAAGKKPQKKAAKASEAAATATA